MTNFDWWREQTNTIEGAADTPLTCANCIYEPNSICGDCRNGTIAWLRQERREAENDAG